MMAVEEEVVQTQPQEVGEEEVGEEPLEEQARTGLKGAFGLVTAEVRTYRSSTTQGPWSGGV